MENLTIFDIIYEKYKITKPVRLIELFSGYGSQALALKYLGINFEHWKTCEWAIKSIQAYKDIHFTNEVYNSNLTKEEYIEYLFNKGISSNYNEPMTYDQIKRLNEKQLKTIYDNIQITNNLVNIQQVKGESLQIVNTNKYDYILTYSFPCQDLSLAGKKKGMSDTSTRSGMLWEVERILTECKELGNLPQILIMENVPQVHSQDNLDDFNKWKLRLEQLGYNNYWQDLIATDFGIPQTRNRCFMISILGDYNYTFPKPIPLKLKLKDMLEDKVDEKYYLTDSMIEYLENGKYQSSKVSNKLKQTDTGICPTLDTMQGGNRQPFIKVKNATKKGYLEAYEGDGVNISSRMKYQRENVQKDSIQTLTTSGSNDIGVVVGTYQYSKSDNFMKGKSRYNFAKEVSDTIQTTQKEEVIFLEDKLINNPLKGKTKYGWHFEQNVYDDESCCRTLKASEGSGNKPKVIFNLRIRKLTPKECFRLMGVKDEDFEKVRNNQSDSSLYHLAGDSIVVNVLMAIFGELFEIDWQNKIDY